MSKVGLLVVSHSKRLALGVVEVAKSVAGEDLCMVAVGGDETLGVNAHMVSEGLEELHCVDEIGIIGDIGSSFLSASAALDSEDARDHVTIVDCPMVEGTIAATMVLAMGGTLGEAVEAAEHAWSVRKIGN